VDHLLQLGPDLEPLLRVDDRDGLRDLGVDRLVASRPEVDAIRGVRP
jgi:hypothetical protein